MVMASSNRNSRKSVAFLTPQNRRVTSRGRFSMSNVEDENERDPEKTLFETLMNDPLKRSIVKQFLSQATITDQDILDLVKKTSNATPKIQNNKQFESPTAQFRRRALEALNTDNSSSSESFSHTALCSSVQFDHLLKDVVAYVEIVSNNLDRSAGIKALLTAMGAKIVDKIYRGVTHVIFKDGSFASYRKAKLVNAHLVSVLWLEAVRTKRYRVPEKNYPALGTEAFNPDVSVLCEELQKDYEDIVKDEMVRSRNLKRLTHLNLQFKSSVDDIELSQEHDTQAATSKVENYNRQESLNLCTPESLRLNSSQLTSDTEPIIDGDLQSNCKNVRKLNIANLPEFTSDSESLVANNSCSKSKNNCENSLIGIEYDVIHNLMDSSSSAEKSKTCPKNSVEEVMKIKRASQNGITGFIESLDRDSNFDEHISNLRISDSNNKENSTESEQLSALQISNLSKHSVEKRNCENINLKISKNSSIGHVGFSEPVPSLRISDVSTKKCRTKSSSRRSLRISADSNKIRLESLMINAKQNVSSPNFQSAPIRKSQKDSFVSSEKQAVQSDYFDNITLRKKKKLKAEVDHLLVVEEKKEVSQKKTLVKGAKRKLYDPNDLDYKEINFEDIAELKDSDKMITKTKNCETNKKNFKNSTLNWKKSQQALEKNTEDTGKHNQNLQKTRRKSMNAYEKKFDILEPLKNIEVAPVLITNSARVFLQKKLDNIFRSDEETIEESDESGSGEKGGIEKSKTNSITTAVKQNKRDRKMSKIINSEGEKTESVDGLLTTTKVTKKSNDASAPTPTSTSVSNKQKSAIGDRNIFKTPSYKHLKAKKVHSEKKSTGIESIRNSARVRNSMCSHSIDEKALIKNVDQIFTSQRNRRSTLEFQQKTPLSQKRKTTAKLRLKSSIVCSRFHNSEVQVFQQIVNKLGMFRTEDEVSEKTSHLVIAEPKRTINLLRALARGCWILKSEWLYKSLENGKWLPEEDFELTEFSPAVTQSRQHRQAFGASYSMDIFQGCGKIYIAKGSIPRCSDLQELVSLCKGRITTIYRNAEIIVGEYTEGDATCVSENWLMDCITFYKRKSLKKYLIEPKIVRRSDSPDF